MRTMLDVFRDKVARTPDAEVFGRTCAELDADSDAFAAALLDRGFLFGDMLAIAVPDGADLVTALVGVWKAGGSAVLADPDATTDALVELLTAVHAKALFADRGHDAVVARTDVHIVIAGADHLRDLLALHAGERPLASAPDPGAVAVNTTTQGAMASSATDGERVDRIARLAFALAAPDHEGEER
jgi:acyl-CoA synthetase (AMP-forming)/AMP-acid ligase II